MVEYLQYIRCDRPLDSFSCCLKKDEAAKRSRARATHPSSWHEPCRVRSVPSHGHGSPVAVGLSRVLMPMLAVQHISVVSAQRGLVAHPPHDGVRKPGKAVNVPGARIGLGF